MIQNKTLFRGKLELYSTAFSKAVSYSEHFYLRFSVYLSFFIAVLCIFKGFGTSILRNFKNSLFFEIIAHRTGCREIGVVFAI